MRSTLDSLKLKGLMGNLKLQSFRIRDGGGGFEISVKQKKSYRYWCFWIKINNKLLTSKLKTVIT